MYTPLNIKTENSLLKSTIKIDELIKFAKENNLKSLTITDNKMYGAYEFYKKCRENNIKPIIGLEIKIDENKIILYAKNYIGYKNLLKISSIEKTNENDLKKYSSNLICILPYGSSTNIKYETIFYSFKNNEEKEKIKEENKIYMGEILCIKKEEQEYLRYIESIKTGIPVKNIEKKLDKYLKLENEIDKINNEKIEEMCNLEIELKKNLLPNFKTPNNETQYEYLKHQCVEGLKRIFGTTTKQIYVNRLKYELEIINKMGFSNYFLIVYDYVKYAKENNILVGPGRGSAAGSLVAYTLNITTIDPIKYNLIFERFLNSERITMPDIDIDFEYTKREEMIKYCIKKYGEKCVAPIITFGTLGAKQAIRDIGKTLEIPIKTIDRICKEIDSSKTLITNYKENKKIKELLETDKTLINLYKISAHLEGLKRHTSIHAAGIVMSDLELDEIIPLDKTHDFYTTGYTMEYLEEQGLLKMDFLALKTLTLISNIARETKINLEQITMNDQKTIQLFQEGKTNGIFQFESEGMINLLKKFKPNNFEEIFAIIALYRPGPMDNIETYIKRKRNIEKIDYIIKDLEPILKSTYGIIIYQEQIMQIAEKLASYTLGEADILRRAMSKRKESILINEKERFIRKSVLNGYNEQDAKKVYDLILKFASYGFNKAHSVAYATISYKMAYLKAHYPLIFMKNLLNSSIGSETKTKEYIYICKTMGLNILKPDINESEIEYKIKDNNLIYPLTGIKGLGTITAEKIIKNRNTPYKDIFDYIKRNNDTKSLETMIYAGCFDNLNYNKKTLIDNIENIKNYADLKDLLDDTLIPIIEKKEEYDISEIMEKELEIFGFYLSNHPITKYKIKYNSIDIKDIPNYFDKKINIVVYVDRIKEVITKKNEKMCFITASDELEMIDVVFFPKTYNEAIKKHNIIYLDAKVEKRYDKYQLIVNRILEIIK